MRDVLDADMTFELLLTALSVAPPTPTPLDAPLLPLGL